jgi:hypothetical protein
VVVGGFLHPAGHLHCGRDHGNGGGGGIWGEDTGAAMAYVLLDINVGAEAETARTASSAISINGSVGVEVAGTMDSHGLDGKRWRWSTFCRRVASK